MNTPTTVTIGCDLGDRRSHFCVLDEQGNRCSDLNCATTRAGFHRVLRRFDAALFVIEAGTHSPWVSEMASEMGHQVIVANPRNVHLIGKSRRKTDAVDAELLARLGRFEPELLFPIQHRGKNTRSDLAIIRSRHALVRARTLLINHVRGVIKSNGERLNNCTTAVFARRAAELIPDYLQPALNPILKQIEALSKELNALTRVIEVDLPQRHPEIRSLQQVPGVGPITSAAFVLTIEDPGRFRDNRKVGSYLGLAPARRQTGARDPELSISKAGDEYLRGLLVECSQYILSRRGPDSDLKRWGLQLASRGRKAAKKRALIATARKLSVLLCSLLRSGAGYQPLGYSRQRAAA